MSGKSKKDMDIARKVWLAGIGAYGRAIGDAQDAYAKMGKETTKVFEELVGKGQELENKVSTVAKQYAPEIAEKHRTNVEDRMERMKAALGLAETSADQAETIERLEARLDSIDAKLDKLIAASKPTSAKPRTRKAKPAAKKATAAKK
ncbi:phasin family protein [Kordiimonas aquimaris]|uniref:phasin family protein n=1 Tax=Kordiimonas aquimaris TaxID=707591 RepID=UPI0021CEE311|nr:phasin family protein [Kordiimonas aquimaris]